MTISLYSVIMSIVCSSIILFAASFLVSHSGRVRWGLIFLILGLGFIRLLFPVEIRVAREVREPSLYPRLILLSRKEWFAGLTIGELLLIAWGIGLVVLFFVFLGKVREIREITERSVPSIAGDRLYELFEKAKAELGYAGKARIAITGELYTAVSVGVFAPNILIPKIMLEYEDLELCGVLKHELTHYLRGDIGKQRLLNAVQCLFWWNPVVYYLKGSMENMMELECDEKACSGMTQEERKSYLRAITKTLRAGRNKGPSLGMGYWKNTPVAFLKRRFQEVLCPEEKHSHAATYVMAMVCLALFCISYAFILQPIGMPREFEQSEVTNVRTMEGEESESEFLIKLPDGNYLYVSGLLGEKIIKESDIQQAPYSELPIFIDIGKGD